jgi:hypothetical protein
MSGSASEGRCACIAGLSAAGENAIVDAIVAGPEPFEPTLVT